MLIIMDICRQVAQATSNQMSKRDPLRPYMDVIDNMLAQMVFSLSLFTNSSTKQGLLFWNPS